MSSITHKGSLQTYCKMAAAIIEKQKHIIGEETALKKARKITDIVFNNQGQVLSIKQNPEDTLKSLVEEYATLSGDTAIKFAQEAIRPIMEKDPSVSLPFILQQAQEKQKLSMEDFLQSF